MLRKDYGNNNDNNKETITIVINLFLKLIFGKKCLKKRLPDDELWHWKK